MVFVYIFQLKLFFFCSKQKHGIPILTELNCAIVNVTFFCAFVARLISIVYRLLEKQIYRKCFTCYIPQLNTCKSTYFFKYRMSQKQEELLRNVTLDKSIKIKARGVRQQHLSRYKIKTYAILHRKLNYSCVLLVAD